MNLESMYNHFFMCWILGFPIDSCASFQFHCFNLLHVNTFIELDILRELNHIVEGCIWCVKVFFFFNVVWRSRLVCVNV
jgi:hypothetical protein